MIGINHENPEIAKNSECLKLQQNSIYTKNHENGNYQKYKRFSTPINLLIGLNQLNPLENLRLLIIHTECIKTDYIKTMNIPNAIITFTGNTKNVIPTIKVDSLYNQIGLSGYLFLVNTSRAIINRDQIEKSQNIETNNSLSDLDKKINLRSFVKQYYFITPESRTELLSNLDKHHSTIKKSI